MKNKGITLIALVVTVIIMIILAGITLNLVIGENGVLARARQSRDDTIVAQEKENINLSWHSLYIEQVGDIALITSADMQKEINKTITGDENATKVTVENSTESGKKFKITYAETSHIYFIDDYGQVSQKEATTAETPSPYSLFDFTTATVDGVVHGYISLKAKGTDYQSPGTPKDENGVTVTKVIIPSIWSDGTPVTDIADSGFMCVDGVEEIVIPSSIETIGSCAFYWNWQGTGYNLNKITFEDGSKLKTISDEAFENCAGLTDINFPEGLKTIGSNAFDGCFNLYQVNIPSSVTTIGISAFRYCEELYNITMVNGLESIGSEAFIYCIRLNNITIPSTVTNMGSSVFYDWKSTQTINVLFKSDAIPTGWDANWKYNCSATINYAP